MKRGGFTKTHADCGHDGSLVYKVNGLCWDCHGLRLFRLRALRWFVPLALLLTACGGSVEQADPPPECPTYLHTLRFAEPTLDPSGTSAETATRCITPDGTPAVFSEVWCCQ